MKVEQRSTIAEKLRLKSHDLTATERKLMSTLFANYPMAGLVSITEYAREAGVSAPGQEGPTLPLINVEGDINRLVGDGDAVRPYPLLRAVSRYGFEIGRAHV